MDGEMAVLTAAERADHSAGPKAAQLVDSKADRKVGH
jgi:hypothetical protein